MIIPYIPLAMMMYSYDHEHFGLKGAPSGNLTLMMKVKSLKRHSPVIGMNNCLTNTKAKPMTKVNKNLL